MEVVVQSPSKVDNFDLSSVLISPYLSAPSSPTRFGEYYAEFYQEFDFISSSQSSSNIPFERSTKNVDGDDDGFAFYVSDELDKLSLSAEELFHGGKIKSFKLEGIEKVSSSHVEKKSDHRSDDIFSEQRGRGRDKTPASSSVLTTSNSCRRVSRSHSPYRISQYTWEQQQQHQPQEQEQVHKKKEKSTLKSTPLFSNTIASSSSSSSKVSSRRWRLKDFILFRSASEGRESSKESFKKEGIIRVKKGEVVGNGSMRRKGPISAHEMHYAMKRAESEDLKKRTFLPYKQGILSRLAGFGI